MNDMTNDTTYLKATGDSGYTLYLVTDDAIYCEIHYPSGDFGFHKLGPEWSVERLKGQLGAEEVLL